MAKPAKRGLGRGLSSLMGSYDSEPQKTMVDATVKPVQRETVTAQEKPKPVVEKPAPAKEPEKKPVEAAPAKPVKTEKPTSEESLVAKNDGVTIMGVVERETKKPEPVAKTEEVVTQDLKKKIETHLEEVTERAADEVDINSVEPNPSQPRTMFNKDEMSELSDSIKKDGLLQPILVRSIGKKYQIIAGERRWQAAKNAGLKTIPVRVVEADDEKAIELALIENLQRSDLNPIEEAYGYKRMMERGKKTQSEIATAVSKGRSTIANALRLLDLPEEAQQLLYEGKITAGHARAILSIPSKEGQMKLIDKMKAQLTSAEGKASLMSVREAENIARLLSGRQKSTTLKTKVPVPAFYKTAAKSLSDVFGTKVRVKSSNGKNKIEIEFKDERELKRIYELISQEQAE